MVELTRLKNTPVFSDMPEALQKSLAEGFEEKKISKGDPVFSEGETTGSLFFIAGGSVAVEKKMEGKDGGMKVVARLGSGEFFGDMAFIENEPHSATVRALTEAAIWVLPRRVLDDLLKKDPESALNQVLSLYRATSARLRGTTSELVTVFEVARAVGQPLALEAMLESVFNSVLPQLPEGTSAAFYRWNPFNEDFELQMKKGPGLDFPSDFGKNAPLLPKEDPFFSTDNLEQVGVSFDPLPLKKGSFISSLAGSLEAPEGIFLFAQGKAGAFSSGQKQMVETISAVIGPALAALRAREEDDARRRFEQNRAQGYSL